MNRNETPKIKLITRNQITQSILGSSHPSNKIVIIIIHNVSQQHIKNKKNTKNKKVHN